jgi:hypothetical protein
MCHCPDSGRFPVIIVQPAPVRSELPVAARPDDTGHRAACALPGYIDPAVLRRLREMLDHWLRTQGLRIQAPGGTHSPLSPRPGAPQPGPYERAEAWAVRWGHGRVNRVTAHCWLGQMQARRAIAAASATSATATRPPVPGNGGGPMRAVLNRARPCTPAMLPARQ